jgi:hypothetical protein
MTIPEWGEQVDRLLRAIESDEIRWYEYGRRIDWIDAIVKLSEEPRFASQGIQRYALSQRSPRQRSPNQRLSSQRSPVRKYSPVRVITQNTQIYPSDILVKIIVDYDDKETSFIVNNAGLNYIQIIWKIYDIMISKGVSMAILCAVPYIKVNGEYKLVDLSNIMREDINGELYIKLLPPIGVEDLLIWLRDLARYEDETLHYYNIANNLVAELTSKEFTKQIIADLIKYV